MSNESPRVSECPICPPWVERCAHFDDEVIYLYDSDVGHCPCSTILRKSGRGTPSRYTVGFRSRSAPCPIDGIYRHSAVRERAYCGDEHDEALSAFEAAEAALLGREVRA